MRLFHLFGGFFFFFFFLNPSFKVAMSGGRRASSQVNLLVNRFSKLYVTLLFSGLLSYLVDEEEDQ